MNFRITQVFLISALVTGFVSGCNSDKNPTSQNTPASQTNVMTSPASSTPDSAPVESDTVNTNTSKLDDAEEAHLVFMREEEKLARDVYMTLSNLYPASKVFANIGEGSEQTHTDMVRDQLAFYGIEDPNPKTNILPASIGVYTGGEYGEYFSGKYSYLVEKGSRSELDALYVGAFIEELDMHDIVECPAYILETEDDITACGLNYTDEASLINSYSSLLDGSKNHLRAFVGQIEAIIGEGKYVAQIISQEEVAAILGR